MGAAATSRPSHGRRRYPLAPLDVVGLRTTMGDHEPPVLKQCYSSCMQQSLERELKLSRLSLFWRTANDGG
jgi:hypothetical protein